MLDSGLDKHGLCKQQGLSAGQGVPTMNPASLPTHHPTPTPASSYHDNRRLVSRQSRQLPVEELGHIPAAAVSAD